MQDSAGDCSCIRRCRGIELAREVTKDRKYRKGSDVLKQIDEGKWPQAANAPGTRGGSSFEDRDGHLPTTDGSGKPITYKEWDVDPKLPDQNRVGGRIVTASDGSAWYAPDHYATFQRLR